MEKKTFNIKNTDIAYLFTKDVIAKEDIFNKLLEQDDEIQELKYESEDLKDRLNYEEQVKEDYYTPKSPYDIYGLSERDFI